MLIKKLPIPFKPCHECGAEYAGTHCPVCKTEHPTFTAIKNISREEELEQAVRLAGEVC